MQSLEYFGSRVGAAVFIGIGSEKRTRLQGMRYDNHTTDILVIS